VEEVEEEEEEEEDEDEDEEDEEEDEEVAEAGQVGVGSGARFAVSSFSAHGLNHHQLQQLQMQQQHLLQQQQLQQLHLHQQHQLDSSVGLHGAALGAAGVHGSLLAAPLRAPASGNNTCKQCSRSFRSRSDLTSHERTHSGDKPLVCSLPGCGRCFAHVSNLRVHERGHAGERPHVCPFPACGRAFRHPSSRDDHYVAVHQNIRQYVCGSCQRDFTASSNLKRHQKTCVMQGGGLLGMGAGPTGGMMMMAAQAQGSQFPST
jgi:uncharacterized Zn-finger protein